MSVLHVLLPVQYVPAVRVRLLEWLHECRTPSALFFLTLVLFALSTFFHSPSFTAFSSPPLLGLMDKQKLRQPPLIALDHDSEV